MTTISVQRTWPAGAQDRGARGRQTGSRLRRRGALSFFATLALAACSSLDEGPVGSTEQAAHPIDRLLIGRAASYPAESTLRARAGVLEADMSERRRVAWSIVEKVLMPVRIAASVPADDARARVAEARLSLPRFQTWYSREDVLPMFDRLFRALPDADKRARSPFAEKSVEEIFPWNAGMARSLASFTEERLAARRRELSRADGVASLGKDARVLMSPAYVGHLLGSYGKILDCQPTDVTRLESGAEPPDLTPCLGGEFPEAAAAVKARWMSGSSPVPTYDTSAAALRDTLAHGTFGAGDGQADPDGSSIYTMRVAPDRTMRLVALHIMTKELHDWVWITLWWSPDPNSDFGADRPASITGPFAHYKMCVVTAYAEKDTQPGSRFAGLHPTLGAALDSVAARGPSTWCSNPYLETPERAATTNCIGCHQHGGTGETTDTILSAPARFPDFARTKLRTTFPSDYSFTMGGGLDLAAEMRARAEALMN